MKITGYQQSITNVGGSGSAAPMINANVQAKAAASDGINFNPLAKGLNDWANTIEKIRDQEDNERIMKAMDAYNKSRFEAMYNEQNGFMNTKADGANGIAEGYIEQEKKYRQEILGSTKLHSRAKQVALDNLMNQSAQQGFQQVARHQYQQKEVALDLNLDNNVQNISNFMLKNYDKEGAVDGAIAQATMMVDARYSGVDTSGELREKAIKKYAGMIVGNVINTAMDKEDYETARKYAEGYAQYLTPEQNRSVNKVIFNKQQSKFETDFADSLFKQYGDNADAAIASLENAQGFSIGGKGIPEQKEGTTWARMSDKTSLVGLYPKTRKGLDAAALIYSKMFPGEKLLLTSGTDGTHETHKGESIDVNDDWGKTILADKKNRDKFKAALSAQGIRVLDEYERDTKYKTGPHLHLEFNDFNPDGDVKGSPMSTEQKERIKKHYYAKISENKRLESIRNDNLCDAFFTKIYEGVNNGTITYDQAMAMARTESGGDRKLFPSYTNTVNSLFSAAHGGPGGNTKGGGAGNGKGANSAIIASAKEMLRNGSFRYQEEYTTFIANRGGNMKQVLDASQDYKKFKNGTGEFNPHIDDLINGAIADAGGSKLGGSNKALLKKGLRTWVSREISDYIIKNNHDPSDKEIANMIDDAMTKRTFTYERPGKYFKGWMSTEEVSLDGADLANMGIETISERNQFGLYTIKMTDGRVMQVDAQRLEAMKDGVTGGR